MCTASVPLASSAVVSASALLDHCVGAVMLAGSGRASAVVSSDAAVSLTTR